MRAGEILAAVEARLRRANRRSSTVYRREWSIGVGATRVDLAAINGRIAGYEVKSALDNFGRLAGRVSRYSAVLEPAVRAGSLVPPWWGIWARRTELRRHRAAHRTAPARWERLAAELPLATLRYEVREAIKTRPRW